jgi:hypothetical protein
MELGQSINSDVNNKVFGLMIQTLITSTKNVISGGDRILLGEVVFESIYRTMETLTLWT